MGVIARRQSRRGNPDSPLVPYAVIGWMASAMPRNDGSGV